MTTETFRNRTAITVFAVMSASCSLAQAISKTNCDGRSSRPSQFWFGY